ncbi:MAG TPA: hypothetical protein VF192_02425 [Longimicrobiales bacterium]
MSRTRKALLIVGGVVLAFVLGFGWQYVRAQALKAELANVRQELALLRAEAALGAAAVAALQNNHEVALKLTSDFFTRLQQEVDTAPARARAELEQILGQRDAVITVVSRASPEASSVLTRLYVRYRVAIGGPDQALPIAAQPPASSG